MYIRTRQTRRGHHAPYDRGSRGAGVPKGDILGMRSVGTQDMVPNPRPRPGGAGERRGRDYPEAAPDHRPPNGARWLPPARPACGLGLGGRLLLRLLLEVRGAGAGEGGRLGGEGRIRRGPAARSRPKPRGVAARAAYAATYRLGPAAMRVLEIAWTLPARAPARTILRISP